MLLCPWEENSSETRWAKAHCTHVLVWLAIPDYFAELWVRCIQNRHLASWKDQPNGLSCLQLQMGGSCLQLNNLESLNLSEAELDFRRCCLNCIGRKEVLDCLEGHDLLVDPNPLSPFIQQSVKGLRNGPLVRKEGAVEI